MCFYLGVGVGLGMEVLAFLSSLGGLRAEAVPSFPCPFSWVSLGELPPGAGTMLGDRWGKGTSRVELQR